MRPTAVSIPHTRADIPVLLQPSRLGRVKIGPTYSRRGLQSSWFSDRPTLQSLCFRLAGPPAGRPGETSAPPGPVFLY